VWVKFERVEKGGGGARGGGANAVNKK